MVTLILLAFDQYKPNHLSIRKIFSKIVIIKESISNNDIPIPPLTTKLTNV